MIGKEVFEELKKQQAFDIKQLQTKYGLTEEQAIEILYDHLEHFSEFLNSIVEDNGYVDEWSVDYYNMQFSMIKQKMSAKSQSNLNQWFN